MLIPTSFNTKTVSDMRQDPVGLLAAVDKSGGPQYIFYRSTPRAVILKISHYKELLETVEDYRDGLLAQKLEKEDKKRIGWLSQKGFEKKAGLAF